MGEGAPLRQLRTGTADGLRLPHHRARLVDLLDCGDEEIEKRGWVESAQSSTH